MDEINIGEGSSGTNPTGTTIADRHICEQQLAIYSQLRLINDTINSPRVKIEADEVLYHRQFQILNKKIQRATMLVFTKSNVTLAQQKNIGRATGQNVSLSSTQLALYILWEENTKGI